MTKIDFSNLTQEQITWIETIRTMWVGGLKDASNFIRPHAGILHAFSKRSNGQNNKELNSNWANVYDGFLDLIVYLTGACFKLDYNKFIKSEVYKDAPASLQKVMQRIIQWNIDRGLTDFDAEREFSFVCEETYELMFQEHSDSRKQGLEIAKNAFLRPAHEKIPTTTTNEQGEEVVTFTYKPTLKKVDLKPSVAFELFTDLLDSALQSAIRISSFLNINVIDYLNLVMDANDKKGKETDSGGKIVKDKSKFLEPESQF